MSLLPFLMAVVLFTRHMRCNEVAKYLAHPWWCVRDQTLSITCWSLKRLDESRRRPSTRSIWVHVAQDYWPLVTLWTGTQLQAHQASITLMLGRSERAKDPHSYLTLCSERQAFRALSLESRDHCLRRFQKDLHKSRSDSNNRGRDLAQRRSGATWGHKEVSTKVQQPWQRKTSTDLKLTVLRSQWRCVREFWARTAQTRSSIMARNEKWHNEMFLKYLFRWFKFWTI